MKKFLPFLCVFMYFMSPYRLGGHEMPEIIGLFALFLAFLSRYKCFLPKSYVFYLVYIWLIPLFSSYICRIPGKYLLSAIPVALILSTCYIGFLMPNLNKKLVLKYYRWLVYIAVAFFVIQEFSHIIIGYRPVFFLPFLEMYYEDSNSSSMAAIEVNSDRSASFFLEPSHFVQYIIPYYCISLSRYLKTKKNILEVLALTLVIIWLRAGVGYVALLAIGSFYFLRSGVMKMYQKIIIVVFVFAGYILLTTVYANNEYVSAILDRTSEFSMTVEESGSQSGFLRIWRGYFIYASMNFASQLFGVGPGCLDYVCNAVIIPGTRYEGTYMNGIQLLLVTGGIVGLMLFFNYLFRFARKLDVTGKCILIAMICIFLMEHMYNTPKMFLYLLLASCFTIKKQRCKFKKKKIK